MGRQPDSVSLPWKRDKDGLVAELGAVFRIKLEPAGWECSVSTGKCTEIVNKGLPTQKASKAHAESYAGKVPEVAAAVAERKRTPPKPSPKSAKPANDAAAPAAGAAPAGTPEAAPAYPFERLDDGCIFGRAGGVCWVADDRGVEFAAKVDPAVKAEVEKVAAQHFSAARDEKTNKRAAALAKCQAAAAAARQAKKEAAAKPSRGAARKTAAASKTAASKKKAGKRAAKQAAQQAEAPAAPAKKAAKKAGRGRKKAATKRGAKEGEPVARKSVTPKTKPAEVKAAVTWTDSGGEVRGAAAHGTFVLQPEGSRHALYFYEPGGQSRHLQSGDATQLRKAAEEMAARGQPAPERETLSAEKEEALLRMFAAGAVGSP